MKSLIIFSLLLITGCGPGGDETQTVKEAFEVGTVKESALVDYCATRGHAWNGQKMGPIEPMYHQTIIDYKDSTVLFDEKIHIWSFECIRCKKEIFDNDTIITNRVRIFPPVEHKRDTTSICFFLPTDHIFKPKPPVKR
jgi:hypothetical protein